MAPSKKSTTATTTTGREAKAKATATPELGIRREQQQRRRNDEYHHHVNHHLNHDLTTLIRKGPWKAEEDEILLRHVSKYGPRDWSSLRSKGLLLRTGKSCRLRWVNKLRPNLKNGCKFSAEEERIVIELQAQLGNKWAKIATYLQGRTDNDVKNFWSSRQKRLARLLNSSTQHRVSSTTTTTTTTASASSSSCSNNLTARRPPPRKSLKQEDPFFNINHHHHQQAAPISTTSSVALLEDSTSTTPLLTTTGAAAPIPTGSVFPVASSSSSSSIAIDPLLINLHFPLDANNILPTTSNQFIIPYDTKNPVDQHYPCNQEDQRTPLLPNDHFPSSSLIQDPLHSDSFHLFYPDDLKLQQDLLLQDLDPLNRFDHAFAAGAADLNHSVSGPSLVGFDHNNIDHDDRLKQMINPLDLPFFTQGGSCSYNTNYINIDGSSGSGGGGEEAHDHKMSLAGDELSAIFLHQNHHLHPAVAPDTFFDDLPPDIFDQIEPLPSPPSDWS